MNVYDTERMIDLVKPLDYKLTNDLIDADLVIFDPTIVKDQATFLDSRQYPVGIDYVIVNGQIAVSNGQFTGTTAGVVVSKNR